MALYDLAVDRVKKESTIFIKALVPLPLNSFSLIYNEILCIYRKWESYVLHSSTGNGTCSRSWRFRIRIQNHFIRSAERPRI